MDAHRDRDSELEGIHLRLIGHEGLLRLLLWNSWNGMLSRVYNEIEACLQVDWSAPLHCQKGRVRHQQWDRMRHQQEEDRMRHHQEKDRMRHQRKDRMRRHQREKDRLHHQREGMAAEASAAAGLLR